MTDTWKSFVLPEAYKPAEDGSLQTFLQANSTAPIKIDASKLGRLDTMLIEYLLCAAKDWRQRGLPFELTQLNRPNAEVMTYLGLKSDHIIWRAAA